MKQKAAALYARFSSDMQKDRSIDDQFAVCKTYAKRENFKVTESFLDRAKSGATLFDRTGLIDLMAAAKKKEFDVVIVENLDRLSRDQEDLAGLFKRLNFYGVEIRTVNEGVTTSMHIGIRGMVSSMFLTDLSAKVKRGHNGRVREGKIPGAVTYGYDLILGQPGDRVINPVEASVVKRIFTLYAKGVSPRAIAIGLTRDGIPTPNGNVNWNHQTFVGGSHQRGFIGNRLYIGEIVWNSHHTVIDPETGSKTKRASPAEELITTAVPHLRIIDQELWDAAQKVREDRASIRSGGTKLKKVIPRNEHLLSGLLRCGECHGHMRIAQTSRNGSPRVACAAAHQHSTCSHRKTYDIDELKTLVLAGFRAGLIDKDAITEAARSRHAESILLSKKHGGERQTAEKQRNRLTVQIDRLVAAIADSDRPMQELLVSLKAKEAERVGLEEKLRLLGAADNVVRLHPAVIEDYKKNVEKLDEALARNTVDPENRLAFQNIMDSIVIHPTGKRMPYEISMYGRLSAIMGVDLFPTQRSNKEILAAEGHSCTDSGNTGKSVSS